MDELFTHIQPSLLDIFISRKSNGELFAHIQPCLSDRCFITWKQNGRVVYSFQPSLLDRLFISWKHKVLFSMYIYLTGHLVKAKDIGLLPPYGEVNEMFALSLIGLFEGLCLCADLKRKEN